MIRKRNIPEIPSNLRKKILERDEHCCQKCGYELDLEIHHITPIFLNGRNEVNNLITLCKNCHKYCPDEYKLFLRYLNNPLKFSSYKIRTSIKAYHKYLLFFWSELKDAIKSERMNNDYIIDDFMELLFSKNIPNYKKTFHYKRKNNLSCNSINLKYPMDFIFGKFYEEEDLINKEKQSLRMYVKPNNTNINKQFVISRATEMIRLNPSISYRKIGKELGIHHKTVIKVLQQKNY